MLTLTFSIASLLAAVVTAVAAPTFQPPPNLVLNWPTDVVACEPVVISWTGATGPIEVQIYAGNSDSDTSLEVLPVVPVGTSQTTWIVDTPAGTDIQFYISDLETGFSSWTDNVPVAAGTGTC